MEIHLVGQRRLGQLREALHQVEPRRPCAGERKHARVLDQEQVVLAQKVAKPIGVERALGDPPNERVLELRPPERPGRAVEPLAKRRQEPASASVSQNASSYACNRRAARLAATGESPACRPAVATASISPRSPLGGLAKKSKKPSATEGTS